MEIVMLLLLIVNTVATIALWLNAYRNEAANRYSRKPTRRTSGRGDWNGHR